MLKIPDVLARAIRSGNCVVWLGAGFGGLAGRPDWGELLRRLIANCTDDSRHALVQLLEHGRRSTILSAIRRQLGDEALLDLLAESAEHVGKVTPHESTAEFCRLPWHSCVTGLHAEVAASIFSACGVTPNMVSPSAIDPADITAGHGLTMIAMPTFIVATRDNPSVFDVLEQLAHLRTLLFLGFCREDPDFEEILRGLREIEAPGPHFALLPDQTEPEVEELEQQLNLHAVSFDGGTAWPTIFASLVEASRNVVPHPGREREQQARLELCRAATGLDLRVDLARDTALTRDIAHVERLMDRLPGGSVGGLPAGALLRIGAILFVHGRIERARRCFQHVAATATSQRHTLTARFNLAMTALLEGDREEALEDFLACAKIDRSFALVPPRFLVQQVLADLGRALVWSCRDTQTDQLCDLTTMALPRPVGPQEREQFLSKVERLAKVHHPGLEDVRDGFAHGRLLGTIASPLTGSPLHELLSGPLDLAQALSIVHPVAAALLACHREGLFHGNVNPSQIVITPSGAVVRGFALAVTVELLQPTVAAANCGYLAPDLAAEGTPTGPSDGYALAALLYQLLSGRVPTGAAPPVRAFNPHLDHRVDDLLLRALHPDPDQRPVLAAMVEELEAIRSSLAAPGVPIATTDAPTRELAEPQPALVYHPADPTFLLARDGDDLQACARALRRDPTHVEACQAIARIEATAREGQDWSRVAECLTTRLQVIQNVHDQVELLRELAAIYENQLNAPAHAFTATRLAFEQLGARERDALLPDLRRQAELSGRFAEFADALEAIAYATVEPQERAERYAELGQLWAERLGSPQRSLTAYEQAVRLEPTAETFAAVIPLYQTLGRSAELVGALLSYAERCTGEERWRSLRSAAEVLRHDLGDNVGAFASLEVVLGERPDDAEALAIAEPLARSLGRTDALVRILEQRARLSVSDDDASKALREAAAVAQSEGLSGKAIELLTLLGHRRPADRDTCTWLVALLREEYERAPSSRAALIEALARLVDLVDDPLERAALLTETSALLAHEPDGHERAADCRERILELLPIEHDYARRAAAALERWYVRQHDHSSAARVLERIAGGSELDSETRAEAWDKLLTYRTGQGDTRGVTEALEQLVALRPEAPELRDALLEQYLAASEFSRAGPLLRVQIEGELDPKRKAQLLLRSGRLDHEWGTLDAATAAFEEATRLDPTLTAAWLALRDVYRQSGQPLKSLDAQVSAGRNHTNRLEKTRLLLDAGARYINEFADLDRGLAILETVVELDPDCREATEMLLIRLLPRGEYTRAWPHAQLYVMQTRSQYPNDHALNIKAFGLAAKCAIAVGERQRGREYLEKARTVDSTNLEVVRQLADLDMDEHRYTDAIRHYQSVVLGTSGQTPAVELSRIYLRMADARLGLNEVDKASQMLERALELDPENVGALDKLIAIGPQAGGPAATVAAMRRMTELLVRREQLSFIPEEVQALRERRAALLLELARLQLDELNQFEDGIKAIEQTLAIVGDDPGLLHRLLDLFTGRDRWLDAIGVLTRLSRAQREPRLRAKYLFAAGMIYRDHLGDDAECQKWLHRALELDSSHPGAYAAYVELLQKHGDWRELARAIRAHLKGLPQGASPLEHVELFAQLGEIYERLDEPKTALAALHHAARLSSTAGEDRDTQRERHRRALKLSITLGEDEFEKAVTHAHGLIAVAPMEFEAYHRLVELYLKLGRRDAASALARTLRFLKQADEAELGLAEHDAKGRPALGVLADQGWRQTIRHPLEDPAVSDLCAHIWPVLNSHALSVHHSVGGGPRDGFAGAGGGARSPLHQDRAIQQGHRLANFGISRDQLLDVGPNAANPWGRAIHHAAQVLGVRPPVAYVGLSAEGPSVAAFAVGNDDARPTAQPSVIVPGGQAGELSPTALAFHSGRAVEQCRDEHIAAALAPSEWELSCALWGTLALIHPEFALPSHLRDQAQAFAKLLVASLPAGASSLLQAAASALNAPAEVDTRNWLVGVNYTCARAGFLLCDNLETAAQVLTQETRQSSPVSSKQLVRDLVAFSVSERFLRLRREP